MTNLPYLPEPAPGRGAKRADSTPVAIGGMGQLSRAAFAAARLPEILAGFDERLGDRIEIAQVPLVGGHAIATQQVHLVTAVRLREVVDEEVRHRSAGVMPVRW